MILFVLETHRALHFRSGVDEGAQRVAGKGMVVSAGVDIFELAAFVIVPLGVGAFKEKSFDFVGGVESVFLFLVKVFGVILEYAANVAGVRRPSLVDDLAEDQDLAGTEDVSRSPVERAPIDAQAEIAFALGSEPADRRAVEGEVVPAFEQELLVVVE